MIIYIYSNVKNVYNSNFSSQSGEKISELGLYFLYVLREREREDSLQRKKQFLQRSIFLWSFKFLKIDKNKNKNQQQFITSQMFRF